MPPRRIHDLPFLPPLLLALAIGAAYWSGLHAPFQFDDVAAIVENAAIRHWWPFAQGLPASMQVAGLNLGIALLSRGEMSDAVQTLRRATQLDAASQKAHLNLAVALAQQGALADAAEHAARAVELAPNDVKARELLAHIRLSQNARGSSPTPRAR